MTNQINKNSLWTTIILVFLPTLGALCVDMYLPAYPKIAASFKVTEGLVNLSISTYLIGLGVGQIAYGLLADRFGKKITLIYGVLLFIVSSFICATAPNITVFLIARLAQALGVCSCAVICYALVADIYKKEHRTKIFAIVSGVGILSPILAPFIGGYIVEFFSWRIIFILITLLGITALINIIMFIPNTHTKTISNHIRVNIVFNNFIKIVSNRTFRAYVFNAALLSAITYTWVSFSPKVLLSDFHVNPDQFGYFFLIPALGSALGAFLTARFFHFREKTAIVLGLFLASISTGFLSSMVFLDITISPFLITTIIAINFIGTGIIFPHFIANAMALFTENSGFAAGIIGLIRSLSGAFIGIIAGMIYHLGYRAMSELMFSFIMIIAINTLGVLIIKNRYANSTQPVSETEIV